jgi:hypothetical protein
LRSRLLKLKTKRIKLEMILMLNKSRSKKKKLKMHNLKEPSLSWQRKEITPRSNFRKLLKIKVIKNKSKIEEKLN